MPKSVFAPKLPVPVPSRIETVALLRFATARSSLPSPLKSPTATETGALPVPKSVFAPKLPVPVPSRIETVVLFMVRHRQIELAIAIEIAHRD